MRFGRYTITGTLHAHGPFLVCRATDGDTPVILKILREEAVTPARVEALRRSHALMQEINHPKVAAVEALEWVSDQPALVMRDIGGRTLAERLAEGRLPLPDALRIAISCADALAAIHDADIIHGDMTPRNLISGESPENVVVIDFGLATRGGVSISGGAGLRGTPDYIAPELTGKLNVRADHRADLYSFGIMLYEMLAGRRPFPEGDLLHTVYAHLALAPAPLSDHLPTVPEQLSELVARLLAKRPEDRYQTAAGVRADLLHCLALVEGAPTPEGFTLGARDVPRRLTLSNALHGRETEASRLRQTFEDIRSRRRYGAVAEVVGPAGFGKTAFVESLFPHFDRAGALLAAGRVDSSAGGDLTSALAEALQSIAELLITGRYGSLEEWRARLVEALGDNIAPIVALAPALGQIVGQGERPAPLGPNESATRLSVALRQTFRTLASGETPLVLVVEDVHWAEEEARALLDGLARVDGPERMLVILSRREEEPGDGRDASRTIRIADLSDEDVAEMLSVTFRRPPDETRPLAEAIRRKIGGAPLAIRQFVGALTDEGVIRFDAEAERWVWDLDAVLAKEVGDNLLDLLISRADRLSAEDRTVLGAAACAGRTFAIAEAAAAADVSPEVATRVLERAAAMDWAAPVRADIGAASDEETSGRMRFTHDRVWGAAANMLDDARRRAAHERLAARIEAGLDGPPQGAALHALARHRRAALAPDAPSERVARARGLSAAAGGDALRAGDRGRAHGHFSAAAELLDETGWSEAPGHALELLAGAAGSALLAGRFEEMERHAALYFERCDDPAARAPMHSLRVFSLMAQDRGMEAVDAAHAALDELGEPMPAQVGPDEIGAEVGAVFAALGNRPPQAVAELEDCPAPERAAVQTMLSAMMYPAFSVAPMKFAAAAARLAARSISDGLTEESAVGLNDFGLIACGALGEVDLGYGFSQQARRLVDSRGLESRRARVETVFNAFIRHRKEPIRDTLGGLADAQRTGLATGDVQSAALASFDRAFQIFWIGERLEAAEAAFAESAAFCEDLNVGSMPDLIRLYRQTAAALRQAPEAPERLTGDFADGATLLATYSARRDANGLAQLHLAQALLAHVFGRREAALAEAREALAYLDGITSTPAIPAFHALFAMIANPAERDAAPEPADLEIMRRGADATALWARHAPENYAHHASVAEAELALAEGDEAQWFEKMDLAAEQAGQGGFTRDSALILERIAEVSRARGRKGRYAQFIQNAWRAWVHYGADAKVDRLMAEHGEEIRIYAPDPAYSDTSTSISISLADETLDLGSLLKATRAISQELTVAELLRALLAGIVETAGAERALVVAPDGDDFRLVAEIVAGPSGPRFALAPDMAEGRRCAAEDAPVSALRLVARARVAISSGDAASDPRLSGDAYFSASPRVSAAALPLERGNDLIGVVYLENRQVSDAFSATRLNVLRALCAQAAISWDNAKLYDRQSRLLGASDRFVPAELFRLFNRDSITEVELGDCIERRMTILVSDLRGFSAEAERLGPEPTFARVNEFLGAISTAVRDNDGLVLKYVGDGVLAIFPGGPDGALKAAAEIQEGLRQRRADPRGNLSAGIAIHAGDVMLGAVGDAERLQIDALSDAVNTAFRLEDMTKRFGARVVVSSAAADDLPDRGRWRFRRLGEVEIEGRDKRESLLELIDAEPEELRLRKMETLDAFDEGLRLFERGDYVKACMMFSDVLSRNGADAAASRLFRAAASHMSRQHEIPTVSTHG